jgi:HlyD family secretion protein
VSRVTATGTLSALVTVQVGSQVSGRISQLNANFNSPVRKGMVLAKLDPEMYLAALAQGEANEHAALGNLARSKAQLADAERKLVRAKQLAADKLVSPADADAALAEVQIARAGVQASEGQLMQTRAALRLARVNLAYTTITSPIDGTVISRAVDVGQTVAASLQAPTLFTLAESLTRMQVDTNISEADVGKLVEGAEASFTVDAFPQRRFKGKIRQIRFAPQIVQNVVTYDAVIDVANPELLLRPGMTANVTVIVARADDVLRVPNAALRFRLDPDAKRPRTELDGVAPEKRTVQVLRENKPVAIAVRTGMTDGSFTQVLDGDLSEGDLVIVERNGASKPGGLGGPPPPGMGFGGMGGGPRRGP